VTDASIDLLVVTPAGEVRDYVVEPTGNVWRTRTHAVLHALYAQIGCTAVDVVRLAADVDMWVDEEGALMPHLRVNQLASYIATRFGYPFQLYVGVVVFSGSADRRGDTTSLSRASRETLLALIAELRSIPLS
jgi:hypothetical protein